MTVANGIHRGVPMADYRAWPAYGSSDLKAARQGPMALVKWRREHPDEPSDAMRIGTAAHCAILEPDAFAKRFVGKPQGLSFSTREGKEWRANVAEGVTILTYDEWQQVAQIGEAFANKKAASESLLNSKGIEDSLSWPDPDTGLPLKARPDWYDGDYVTDLKISRHASMQSIPYRAAIEGWAAQVAFYWAGLTECGVPVKGARLVVIHPDAPQSFRVYCVELKQDALGLLHLENERTVKAIAECHESGLWGGAPEDWQKIELPSFATQAVVDWGDAEENTPLTARGGR